MWLLLRFWDVMELELLPSQILDESFWKIESLRTGTGTETETEKIDRDDRTYFCECKM